jgi:hypothetical protein
LKNKKSKGIVKKMAFLLDTIPEENEEVEEWYMVPFLD